MDAAQSLYDLSPLATLLVIGALVALGPLLWVWRTGGAQGSLGRPNSRLRALTVITLFLTFDLVLFGSFTRLTDSGLGCPDWPGCYGHASPVGAHAQISDAQAAMPTGPVTHRKAWVEMVHRYLASGVGALIVVMTALAWRGRRQPGAVNPWWPTLTLVWVCLQGAFGALTVTMKLFPAIVTLHLFGGMVLLGLLALQAARQKLATGTAPARLPPGLRAALHGGATLLVLQILLGGWVSTNYAVLACSEFPTCQGSWWPAMNFQQGFEIWRALGLTGGGEHIAFEALTAIHYVHRLMAYLVLVVLAVVGLKLRAVPGLREQGHWLLALLVWQFASGLSNVVLGWPLVAAVAHTAGAAGLVVVLVQSLVLSRRGAPSSLQPQHANRNGVPA